MNTAVAPVDPVSPNGAALAAPSERTDTPRLLSADIGNCGAARIYDTGRVIYLTVGRTCAGAYPMYGVLGWGTSNSITQHTLTFTLGEPVNVEFEPGTSRIVSVHRRGTWRSFPNVGTWGWRDSAGLLAKDGGLYLLGGWSSDVGGGYNDVWFTSDLQDWRQLTPGAPWSKRHGAAWVVHGDRLYVLGGDLIDDAWSSADGVNWRLESSPAPFGKRYTPVAISDGRRIVLYEGQYWTPFDWCAFLPVCAAVGLNDVWQSTDGSSWERVLEHAPWSGRGLVHGGAYFRGRIYVIGGGLKLASPGEALSQTVAQFSDIWSSADGVTWRLEADRLEFPPRTHFALTATPVGCYVANGSVDTQENLSSEVFFAGDCIHFVPVPDPSPMAPRHGSSLAYFNGSIVVLGGHRDTAGTQIWQYFPDSDRGGSHLK